MNGRSLDVAHVLMAADPTAPHWNNAITLADEMSKQGVMTTIACVREPSTAAWLRAKKVTGLQLRLEGAAKEGNPGPQEWMLFLETLIQPDLVQLFIPTHATLPWRSPTVLALDATTLDNGGPALTAAITAAHLLVIADELDNERLLAVCDDNPYAAIIPKNANLGRNYLLAYQETIQAARIEACDRPDRFELI